MISAKLRRGMMLGSKAVQHRLMPTRQKSALIVAGCQRSGTNMVMNMLERHSRTMVYHERDARAFSDYIMRDLEVIEALHANCRADYFVIKALCELHMLPEIRECLAPARLIWVIRGWPDTTNSMVRSFSGFSKHLQNIARDRDEAGWRGLGMSDPTHQLVKEVASLDPDETSSAAMQWYFRNVLLLEHSLQADEQVYVLNYEKLVSAPTTSIQSICDFANMEYQPRMLGNISPRSIGKNRTPAVLPRVAELCNDLQRRLLAACR